MAYQKNRFQQSDLFQLLQRALHLLSPKTDETVGTNVVLNMLFATLAPYLKISSFNPVLIAQNINLVPEVMCQIHFLLSVDKHSAETF
jgi:hypothetical protein